MTWSSVCAVLALLTIPSAPARIAGTIVCSLSDSV
jgi:hypothetical protein